ncbi:MAG: bifunctional DNA-formamidopyrimidine glycosylase/DNA-(apurinic or apyrimidinic site) lyase [Deltaproteobacteria bacterium]|nr:bifunctional DNA-formamidopyrimidine glycosylase/DNA-(apurinic or apyrimidinic site) lyase [Deltaproteobacteria bacterium]
MPELPEVETVAAALRIHLPGREITRVTARCDRLRRPIPLEALQNLINKAIVGVRRRAKYLLIDMSDGEILVIHLGMTGTLRLAGRDESAGRHDHLDLELDDGRSLRYRDPRKFGLIMVVRAQALGEVAELGALAPEPLSPEFSADYFYNLSRKRTTAVKNFIMDQRRVVGVGNIYASESLFRSRIRPTTAVGTLSLERCRKLVNTIKEVLSEAIATGGTTISDFRQVDGSEGAFARELQVYGRTGEPCIICGQPIEKTVIGGRSTFYCPQCQKR